MLNLNKALVVREIRVTVLGGPTTVQAFVTDEAPTGIADLTPVAYATGEGELVLSPEEGAGGRFVTIWLTQLPQVGDGFRGEVAEVQVLG